MLEKDLEILDQILKDLNFTTTYREILLSSLVNNLERLRMKNITRNFIYVFLSPEEGKKTATEIADYWEEMKQTGSYKTNLRKTIENSPTFSKYVK